jgi:hypothetical protein
VTIEHSQFPILGSPATAIPIVAFIFIYGGSIEAGVRSEVGFVVNSGVASTAIPNTIGPYESRVWNVTDPGFLLLQ